MIVYIAEKNFPHQSQLQTVLSFIKKPTRLFMLATLTTKDNCWLMKYFTMRKTPISLRVSRWSLPYARQALSKIRQNRSSSLGTE
ncbi:hypothetical protein [Vibrio harveyi]|uniref:hypothetical protein n=1 Tax=Vibrio harveyi TaxID=669 RepID=UPI00237DF941|nr:hypothetical protein [Vibrio harveyi]